MSPMTRSVKKHAKARQRRRLHAQERLERNRRQAQQAAEALEQALQDLGLPDNVVAEIEADLPCPFWRKANNFRGLFESLLYYVATIKLVYNGNSPLI